jgi:hypothetical protein
MSTKSASMARRLFAAVPTQYPLPHKEKEKIPHTPLREKEEGKETTGSASGSRACGRVRVHVGMAFA